MQNARSSLAALALMTIAVPALAHPGGWGGPGRGDPGWGPSTLDRDPLRDPDRWRDRNRDDREGKVEVSRFLAPGDLAQALGHGSVEVAPGSGQLADQQEQAAYEAAVVDQLVKSGYQTGVPRGSSSQLVEFTIRHTELEPAGARHKPVSGETDVSVSNRGSSVGMALHLDFSKPPKALVSTRLEARIKDRASGQTLWEGRADIATRDGDPSWSDQAIAVRLADALFGGFPGKSGESFTLR
jgi:hypothetical protein